MAVASYLPCKTSPFREIGWIVEDAPPVKGEARLTVHRQGVQLFILYPNPADCTPTDADKPRRTTPARNQKFMAARSAELIMSCSPMLFPAGGLPAGRKIAAFMAGWSRSR